MKIVVVTGGRNYTFPARVEVALGLLQPDLVVHGDCPSGADKFAGTWADQTANPQLKWPADWSKAGFSAGPIRNRAMVEFVARIPDAERVLVWFPGGKGTANCISHGEHFGFEIIDGERLAEEAIF